MNRGALHECESRYRQLVESTPMGVHIYRLDGEGRLVLEGANPAADAALGVEHRERVGLALEEAFPGLVGTGVPDQLRRVCEVGEPWQADELAYRDGRTQGYFDVHAFRTAPGEMVVMFRDVSERRRAEEVVRNSEERFRQLVESTQDWVWEVDRQGRYTYCSPQCERLLGYSPAELLGHTPFERMPVREARRVGVLFGRLASECKPVVAVPNVNVRRDGRVVVLETSGVPFFGADGELMGYRGMDRDVTERHWAQESIRRLNAGLEERVRTRTAQIQRACEDLESFNYSVSHDLRAPLRAIDGFSRAVLEDSGERLDDAARSYLERVRVATQRMGVLIDDLLTLSRMTRQEMRLESVDLSAMAREIGVELGRNGGGAQVDLRVQPGLVSRADPRLVRLALTNLLGNAWKFTARCAEPRVEFSRRADGAYLIRDNGAGFDMGYAHRLFAPFQRLHSTEEFPGTGIGLAIVQRAVHRHGGRIWAQASPGEGATFFFTLVQAGSDPPGEVQP